MVLRFPEPLEESSVQPLSLLPPKLKHNPLLPLLPLLATLGPPFHLCFCSVPYATHTSQNSSCTQERLSFQTLVSTSGSGVKSDGAPLFALKQEPVVIGQEVPEGK